LSQGMRMLKQVISGGQTGADLGGLKAARSVGLATEGWMPQGFLTAEGPRPEYARLFKVREHASPLYPPRTEANVKAADATLRFATDWKSRGEQLTLRLVTKHKRRHLDIDPTDATMTPERVKKWLRVFKVGVLNVAGNAERTSPGIEAFVVAFLTEVFTLDRADA